MKIIFSGQGNITTLRHDTDSAPAERVLKLAEYLSQKDHDVTVISSLRAGRLSPYRFKQLKLQNRSLIGLLWTIWKEQPDVLHLHGWSQPTWLWLMALLSPLTTYIWTIDTLSYRTSLMSMAISWQARMICDVITVPSRNMQYHVRQRHGLLTTYIPDGYEALAIPEIPLKHFNLRKGQYILGVAHDPAEIFWLAKAYTSSRTKKPLIVLVPGIAGEQKLSRHFPLLRLMPLLGQRAVSTLARHAAVVLAMSIETPLSLLLEAMDSERAIIAINHPLFEETLGVTAQYIRPLDTAGFKKALNAVAPSRVAQLIWGRQAKKRVKHFRYSRTLPEYMKLYHQSESVTIPLDSIVQKFDIVNQSPGW